MKRILALFLMVFILSLSSVYVAADSSIGLDTSYTVLDNGNILVYAAVVNINDPVGLCGVGYDIEYDNNILEIVNVEVNIPDKWVPFVENEMVENWSAQKSDNVYSWALLNCEIGNGITEDHQLYVKIEFSPMVKTNTTINFRCENAVNDNVEEISGESKYLEIDFNKPNNDVSDSNSSSENTQNSQSNSQNSESVKDHSDNIKDNDEKSKVVLENSIGNTLNSDGDTNNDSSVGGIIIVAAILAAIAVGVVAYIRVSKEGK